MLRFWRRWRRDRSIRKVKPGDGHRIKPYRWWQLLHRALFYLKLRIDDDTIQTYAVNINFFSDESNADLYLNGLHHATSKLPATFPVPGGVIEVATVTYGLKRMHYVTETGTEQQLNPDPRSMEGIRMRFDMRFPKLSKIIGYTAIIILLISLILGLPQLIALLTQIPFISERFGTFESPIVLPNWLNLSLLIAGTLAALERALTLRNHWLIDMETSWWDIG